jgi:tetratricopeptide (TPR) repeat protein
MTRPGLVRAVAWGAFVVAMTAPAQANPESVALRARAANQIYNLDQSEAIALFRQAIAADPQDAGAYRGLAAGLWLSITFRRGNMTVDDYLGRINRSGASAPPPPPAEVAGAFRDAIERAINLARQRIVQNPKDAEAHYQLGAAVGLRASYTATVDGSVGSAFRAAREAYNEHEQVLALDPKRKDAGLIVGTYRYIVSTLALPVRWMAYMAGFGGGKDRGLKMIEEAVAYGGENQEDARFALILLYNRDQRFDDALKVLAVLRERYPRNRLVWLESGATCLRAGRPVDAEKFLNEGLARFATDTRQHMFGEEALWYYKRGAARAALGRAADAQADLAKALGAEGRKWVHGRTNLELGKLALKAGRRPAARQAFEAAITLCDADNDGAMADEARRLLNTARQNS